MSSTFYFVRVIRPINKGISVELVSENITSLDTAHNIAKKILQEETIYSPQIIDNSWNYYYRFKDDIVYFAKGTDTRTVVQKMTIKN